MLPILTIGMATYDDYEGVFFTIQALRMYHPEVMDQVEILVIDNNPEGEEGKEVKRFIEGYEADSGLFTQGNVPNGRYIPFTEYQSSFVKGQVFEQAKGDFVLCLDSHVFLVPGSLKKLIDYYSMFPDTKDLIQGPLIHDNLCNFFTHLQPEWNDQMFGNWEFAEELFNAGNPFEIPMQGCGLFSCKKEHWVGFNPKFRGFGGEEWYLQEKFRKHGGRALCLPFLQWMHRFNKVVNKPEYPLDMYARIRNFIIGWTELYGDTQHEGVQSIIENYVKLGYSEEKIKELLEGFPDNYLF
tara:strand:+ start:1164 stop:2054 length:891 start_codon:yes stop_codon:yes gene_type:complete